MAMAYPNGAPDKGDKQGPPRKKLELQEDIVPFYPGTPMVCLFGTSHICHLTTFLNREHISNFWLDLRQVEAHMYGISGMRIYPNLNDPNGYMKSMQFHLRYLDLTHPEYVIIQVGSNDICNNSLDIHTIVTGIYDAAMYALVGGARRVIISQLLPRANPHYNIKAASVNALLEHKVAEEMETAIVCWRHAGLQNPQMDVLKPDGVHLNDTGLYRYFRSLRGAIIYMLNH